MLVQQTKLTFLAPGDALKGRVEPIMWMRMCHEFAKLGLEVELVTVYTYRKENVKSSHIFEHFGIGEPNFKVTILPTPLTVDSPERWTQTWITGFNMLNALRLAYTEGGEGSQKHHVFYTRSLAAIYPYRRMYQQLVKRWQQRPFYFFETHALPQSQNARKVVENMDGVIVNSHKLAKDIEEISGFSREKIQTAYLASHAFSVTIERDEACHRLGLPLDKKYIVYTGKLLKTEVTFLLDVARLLADKYPQVEIILVGGNPKILSWCSIEVQNRDLTNVRFVGFVAPADVTLYQMAATILLVYLDGERTIIDYITPAKVFEYMEAGRPILASDYPILHEILQDGRNALLVEPESPPMLAEAIQRVLNDRGLAERLSQQAQVDSRQYSWKKRVETIWQFMSKIASESCERKPA